MASDLQLPPHSQPLPVGTVLERKEGDRTYFVIQETEDRTTIVESWDDALDLLSRVLRQINDSVANMNAEMGALNERLAAGRRKTAAQIEANQHRLDELVSRFQ